jgi:NAD+ kinase
MAESAQPAFQRIGVIGKFADTSVSATLEQLSNCLLGHGVEVFLDEATAELHPRCALKTLTRSELGAQCDLAIIVGGDGSFLNAARTLAPFDIPMLGINLGRLGFLTDVAPSRMEEELALILAGHYQQEQRSMLHSGILRNGEIIAESNALNDVVLHKWDVARMIEFETYIDGEFVNKQRSDGLVVATPTGSTAYALSGGGPILAPTLDAFVLVPICPHTLSNRPIVVEGKSHIEIVLKEGNQGNAQVTWDGQINQRLHAGDRIRIERSAHPLRLIHPPEHCTYRVLREKLGWSG